MDHQQRLVLQHARQPESQGVPDEASAKPVPLGTYVPPEIKRAFKARCAELGIEMKHGVAEALTDWLATHPAVSKLTS